MSPPTKRDVSAFVEDVYGVTEFEIVDSVELLWSGWEGDTAVVLVSLSDGRQVPAVAAGVHVSSAEIVGVLRERIGAYRRAISESERMLALLGERP